MKTDTTQQNIPNGWQATTLGKVSSITNGSTNTQDATADGEYPLFDRSVEIKKSNKYLFDDTAIILPGEGAEFIPKIYSGKFDLHQRAYAIFPDKNTVDPAYLYQFLYANRKDFVKSSVGSTVKSLRLPLIQSINVSFPQKIKEQQKIAEILGTVDEDIAKTQEVIEATEKLKRGLMQQLFTRGIGHTKFKETEFGEIPTEWNYKKLNEITRQITDGTHRTPKYTQEGIPFLRVTDIQTEKIDWSDIKHISIEEHKELIKRCKPEKGDVLLSKNGTIGITKVVDWDEEFSIFVSLCLIKPDTEQISAEYLCEILRSDFTLNQVKMRSKQGTVTNLHLVEIRDFDIPVPKISEQKKIIEILSATDEKISINKKLKEKLILLKKGLMQDLLSGKVRTTI